MAVYTRTGDRGKTASLYGKMSKSSKLLEALGSIDELNSWIGNCRYELTTNKNDKLVNGVKDVVAELEKMQDMLMTISSILAGRKLKVSKREVTRLETLIDRIDRKLPKIGSFVYPVGPLQITRAVARRAERRVVELLEGNELKSGKNKTTEKAVLSYLNRLSDALFVLARRVNFEYNFDEQVWKKPKQK